MCVKHFLESDFLSGTTKRGSERRNRILKKSAIPTLFHDYPRLAQPRPVEKRSTTLASRQARQDSDNKRLRDEVENFMSEDEVSSLGDLYQKLLQEKLPTGYRCVATTNYVKLFSPFNFLCTTYTKNSTCENKVTILRRFTLLFILGKIFTICYQRIYKMVHTTQFICYPSFTANLI